MQSLDTFIEHLLLGAGGVAERRQTNPNSPRIPYGGGDSETPWLVAITTRKLSARGE